MFKYWPVRLGIDIWRMKLKSPNHVRYRLSVGLWGMQVISASKRSWWTSGAKNITVYFKLTRLCGHCWPSWPILPLINKIKIVSDIGWSPGITAWGCHLIHDNDIGLLSAVATKYLHWSLFCQKSYVRKFSDEFSKYVLQRGEFSKCVFAKGRVFKVRFFQCGWALFWTRFPYTQFNTTDIANADYILLISHKTQRVGPYT